MKLSRFAVVIYPLIIWLLAQAYLFWPNFLYLAVVISVLLTLALTFYLKRPERNTPWWLLVILPILFLLSITTYISLQASYLLNQALLLVLIIFLFSYFKNLYYFWHRPDLFKEEDLLIIKAYASFLTIFFLAADLYGLQSLLGMTVWPMFIIFVILVLIIYFLNLDLAEIDPKISRQFAIINTVFLAEMALVLVFLPLSYNVAALSLGIVYYLMINLSRLYLQKALSSKKIKLYIIISYAGLALLLLTARWLN